jgi:hypothetical protein
MLELSRNNKETMLTPEDIMLSMRIPKIIHLANLYGLLKPRFPYFRSLKDQSRRAQVLEFPRLPSSNGNTPASESHRSAW